MFIVAVPPMIRSSSVGAAWPSPDLTMPPRRGLKTVLFGRWYFPQTDLSAGGFVVTMRSRRIGDYNHAAYVKLNISGTMLRSRLC